MSPSSFIASPVPISALPSLHLRKDIWTHFPVCLIKLPYQNDNRDRYAVQWHQKNLSEWSQGITGYETITRLRLLKALVNSTKWNVESPANPGDLCIIAMKFDEEPKTFSSLPDIYCENPVIKTVDDLKTYFPVCWKHRGPSYAFEFHNTFVRALSKKYDVSEIEIRSHVLNRMIPLMRMNNWSVQLPTKTNEICSVTV